MVAGRTLVVGTRGSALALAQARRVIAGLGVDAAISVVKTQGDRANETPLGEENPAGFFTKEIEEALLAGGIDLAVHSLKDLPIALAHGLSFAALLPRDDCTDVLLVRPDAFDSRAHLPLGQRATVGVSSCRRQRLLELHRPDLAPKPIRGNVPTRVEKVARGEFEATLLSRAGLQRLRLPVEPLLAFDLNPRAWPVAPGQGVIAVEIRAGDEEVLRAVRSLDHAITREAVLVERGLLEAYGGGCHAPFGAFCRVGTHGCEITVAALGRDGVFRVERFAGETALTAREQAERWIRGGCPKSRGPGNHPPGSRYEGTRQATPPDAPRHPGKGDWLCRPALPWS